MFPFLTSSFQEFISSDKRLVPKIKIKKNFQKNYKHIINIILTKIFSMIKYFKIFKMHIATPKLSCNVPPFEYHYIFDELGLKILNLIYYSLKNFRD